MESRIEEFRLFLTKVPKIRDEVKSGKRTWQNVYEEWVLYGEDDPTWNQYKTQTKDELKTSSNGLNMDSFKNVVNYVKKINPDNLNKTLNTVQKVIQVAQAVGGKSTAAGTVASTYSDWWD